MTKVTELSKRVVAGCWGSEGRNIFRAKSQHRCPAFESKNISTRSSLMNVWVVSISCNLNCAVKCFFIMTINIQTWSIEMALNDKENKFSHGNTNKGTSIICKTASKYNLGVQSVRNWLSGTVEKILILKSAIIFPFIRLTVADCQPWWSKK